jgi:hypothetical protein
VVLPSVSKTFFAEYEEEQRRARASAFVRRSVPEAKEAAEPRRAERFRAAQAPRSPLVRIGTAVEVLELEE